MGLAVRAIGPKNDWGLYDSRPYGYSDIKLNAHGKFAEAENSIDLKEGDISANAAANEVF